MKQSKLVYGFFISLFFHIDTIIAEETYEHVRSNAYSGDYIGRNEKTYSGEKVSIFRGVRYAAPPIGFRRWMPPVSLNRSDSEMIAIEYGPSCPQPALPSSLKHTFFYHPSFQTSEDCLYLNIWTPSVVLPVYKSVKNDYAGLPVIVWIHGGGFVEGGADMPLYAAKELAAKGVVVVSFNYRLGVLGYLAHPYLSKESKWSVSGNYGLLDQVEALRWVNKNIEAFGGDKNNITIMGESSGATSVSQLMVSDLAKGLFHKAIMQSPTLPPAPRLREDNFGMFSAEAQGEKVQEILDSSSIDEMRARSADEVVKAFHAQSYIIDPGAVVDGHVFKSQVFEVFELGKQKNIPIIVGYTSGEGNTYPEYGLAAKKPENSVEYIRQVKTRYGDLKDQYLAVYPETDLHDAIVKPIRDATFGWAAQRIARLHSEISSNTYLYYFDHAPQWARESRLGAFHTSDLIYSFNNVFHNPKYSKNWPDLNPTKADYDMGELMSDYWVSFAKTGNPNGSGRPEWKAYAVAEPDYMHFHDGKGVPAKDLLPKAFELHEKIFQQRRKCGNQTWWFNNIGLLAPPVNRKDPCN